MRSFKGAEDYHRKSGSYGYEEFNVLLLLHKNKRAKSSDKNISILTVFGSLISNSIQNLKCVRVVNEMVELNKCE